MCCTWCFGTATHGGCLGFTRSTHLSTTTPTSPPPHTQRHGWALLTVYVVVVHSHHLVVRFRHHVLHLMVLPHSLMVLPHSFMVLPHFLSHSMGVLHSMLLPHFHPHFLMVLPHSLPHCLWMVLLHSHRHFLWQLLMLYGVMNTSAQSTQSACKIPLMASLPHAPRAPWMMMSLPHAPWMMMSPSHGCLSHHHHTQTMVYTLHNTATTACRGNLAAKNAPAAKNTPAAGNTRGEKGLPRSVGRCILRRRILTRQGES